MSENFALVARALAPFVTDSLSLIQAVDAVVDAIDTGFVAPPTYDTHDSRVEAGLRSTEVLNYLRDGKKINAIKELRTITSCGLKEAKDAVEDERLEAFYYKPYTYN